MGEPTEEQVKKLWMWVARFLAGVFDNNEEWDAIPNTDSMDEKTKWDYLEDAKQILTNPEYPLALIDRDFLWKIKAMLRGVQLKQQSDPGIVWETSLDRALREWDNKIIPLASALKELPNDKTG